ncbi:glycosyltransferase family 10 domain-containing protein [Blautia massiliensis (ex Durand et al. 2017)]|uniref:glycosyltransferase family 10 domain-containing protein n=1 Tax=Blautia massiliensis (ex Durand et al. 2017) TaxID=1737424 RepID=UPI00242E264B|nr:glycosyltransferase family 10 [Blautia massiliensis (ex Durand et al. 2017)]MDD6547560.1 glycosyltransferase family 10 [Blautia massiliensis (ex Durand et al. 2017)]
MNPKKLLITWRDERELLRKTPMQETTDGQFSFVNWYQTDPESEFLVRLIRAWFPDCHRKVRFYSVFGPTKAVNETFDGVRIFYNGENIQPRVVHDPGAGRPEKTAAWEYRAKRYREDVRWNAFDLVLGYDCSPADKNYLYIPLWFMRYYIPEQQGKSAYQNFLQMEKARREAATEKRSGACVISSHDFMGSRSLVCDAVQQVVPITYAGKWRNNSQALWNEFENDKRKFLIQFRFNICPENMDAAGYTTEKIFDAYASGCIPLYMGSLGKPAEGILNPKSFVLFDPEKNNEKQVSFIKDISENCEGFLQEPVFLPNAISEMDAAYRRSLKEQLCAILT